MTWDFFAKYVDEAYAIADQAWVDAKGTTREASGKSRDRCLVVAAGSEIGGLL